MPEKEQPAEAKPKEPTQDLDEIEVALTEAAGNLQIHRDAAIKAKKTTLAQHLNHAQDMADRAARVLRDDMA